MYPADDVSHGQSLRRRHEAPLHRAGHAAHIRIGRRGQKANQAQGEGFRLDYAVPENECRILGQRPGWVQPRNASTRRPFASR
jgi:hypothetical protein